MEPHPDTQWKHKPWYVRITQSVMDDLIDKSRVWTSQKSAKFKELV